MQVPDAEFGRLAEEAAEWIALLTQDDSTVHQAKFFDWAAESARHVEAFLLMSAAFYEIARLEVARDQQARKIIAAARAGVAARDVGHGRNGSLLRRRRSVIAAILLGVALPLGALFITWAREVNSPMSAATARTYTTAGVIELGTLSTMRLGTESRAEVRSFMQGRGLEVTLLAGEARFLGKHDPGQPLRVISGRVVLDVLGTEFEVQRRPGITEVAVVDGKLWLTTSCESRVTVFLKSLFHQYSNSSLLAARPLGKNQLATVSGDGCDLRVDIRDVQPATVVQPTTPAEEWLHFNTTRSPGESEAPVNYLISAGNAKSTLPR